MRLVALSARNSLIWLAVAFIFGAIFGCSASQKGAVITSGGEMPVDSLSRAEAVVSEHRADSAVSTGESASLEPPVALAYSCDVVRQALETHAVSKKLYATRHCGGFSVRILTPAYVELVRNEARKRHEAKLEKKRLKGKEIKPEEAEFKDPFDGLESYLHEPDGRYKGLVTIWAEPKVGETKGSWFRNYVLKPISQLRPPGQPFAPRRADVTVTTLQYKGNCKSIGLIRNSHKVECASGARLYRTLSMVANVPPAAAAGLINYRGTRANDSACAGIYQFHPSVFEPEKEICPDIVIVIDDSRKDGPGKKIKLTKKVVRGIWEEFQALALASQIGEIRE